MTDWLTESISKHKSLNNNKLIKESNKKKKKKRSRRKVEKNTNDYIRSN
ncbi:MAG TPA: hypothetical protein VKA98_02690 [Nitrososphaeraceae archaeon]|nr:hypothetical protein [Nitrososphaeraceae archaeon]